MASRLASTCARPAWEGAMPSMLKWPSLRPFCPLSPCATTITSIEPVRARVELRVGARVAARVGA